MNPVRKYEMEGEGVAYNDLKVEKLNNKGLVWLN